MVWIGPPGWFGPNPAEASWLGSPSVSVYGVALAST
jgi:hypothetical protein